MNHKSIVQSCEAMGLTVSQVPDSDRKSFNAVGANVRVYWSTSTLGGLLGLPRVTGTDVRDTHARSCKEIKYLVKVAKDSAIF